MAQALVASHDGEVPGDDGGLRRFSGSVAKRGSVAWAMGSGY